MKVTILGSGTCVPSLKRSSCSVLMEIGESKLLFDTGAGTMRRLLEAGSTISEITHLFYSHLHPDHTGEFVSLLFSTKYPQQRSKPIFIIAARGFIDFYNELKRIYHGWIDIDPLVLKLKELNNIGPDHLEFLDFTLDSLPMVHTKESLGYKITTTSGRTIVYSGDTDFCENLINLSKGADLFICESALPDELKVKGHLTPSLAGEIATKAAVKRLALTHFYPECENVDIEKACRKTYNGQVIIAHDLMEIVL